MDFDVHRKTAAVMFGIPESMVTDRQCKAGKTYNIARQYNASHSTATHLALRMNNFDWVGFKGA